MAKTVVNPRSPLQDEKQCSTKELKGRFIASFFLLALGLFILGFCTSIEVIDAGPGIQTLYRALFALEGALAACGGIAGMIVNSRNIALNENRAMLRALFPAEYDDALATLTNSNVTDDTTPGEH